MRLSAVIIDDDELNLQYLRDMLITFCPDVNIKGTAGNVHDGVLEINTFKPDLLFLDIELHDKTGFDILNIVDHKHMQVILITAHEKYALKAFKFSVVDFLLKPVKLEELLGAIKRSKERIAGYYEETHKTAMVNDESDCLVVVQRESSFILRYDEIMYLEGQGSYSEIVTPGKRHLSSRSLKQNEEILSSRHFVRVHNSFIVNTKFIERIIKTRNGTIILKDGTQIPISLTRKKEVNNRIMF